MAPAFLIAINRRIAVHPGVSYYTVAIMSFVLQTLVFFRIQFQVGVVLLVSWLTWGGIPFYVLVFTLGMTTFRAAFWRPPMERLFTLRFRAARPWFASIVIRLYRFHQLFWHISNIVFLDFHGGVRLTSNEGRDWRHKWTAVQQLLRKSPGSCMGMEILCDKCV